LSLVVRPSRLAQVLAQGKNIKLFFPILVLLALIGLLRPVFQLRCRFDCACIRAGSVRRYRWCTGRSEYPSSVIQRINDLGRVKASWKFAILSRRLSGRAFVQTGMLSTLNDGVQFTFWLNFVENRGFKFLPNVFAIIHSNLVATKTL